MNTELGLVKKNSEKLYSMLHKNIWISEYSKITMSFTQMEYNLPKIKIAFIEVME